MLDFDWEQGLFSLVARGWRRLRPRPREQPGCAHLAEHQERLGLLTQMVAGAPVHLRPSEGFGGILADHILLPATIDLHRQAADNARLYLLRCLCSAIVIRDRLDEGLGHDPAGRFVAGLTAWREASRRLGEELPGCAEDLTAARAMELAHRARTPHHPLEPWLQAALKDDPAPSGIPRGDPANLQPCWLWGELFPAGNETTSKGGRVEPEAITGTEVEAPARDRVSVVELDECEAERSILSHPFEQVETADSWRGGARDCDGEDELSEHADALDECDLHEVIRGGDTPQSLYRCDLLLESGAGDAEEETADDGIPFDEWDHRRRAYRPGWCRVLPRRWETRDPAWASANRRRLAPVIGHALHEVAAARRRLDAQPRQLDGDELDLDAVVREASDRAAGCGGEQRLYRRLARRHHDWATVVLIDISLSADSGVAGRRVLDVSRDAVFVLGEVAAALGDRLLVVAFSSQTRNRCWSWQVCGWDEDWTTGAARLGALRPRGYTRIGPALRHATAVLERQRSERRQLFLLSDGKPTDYDRYEGRYGIADVRRAVGEARTAGVDLHAFAVDATARAHLPAQFGTGNWSVMTRTEELPGILAGVYARSTQR